MNIFFGVVILLQTSNEVSSLRQNFTSSDVYQLLSDVQSAIHTFDSTALVNVITTETFEMTVYKIMYIQVHSIPVLDIVKVENINVDHFPNMTFTAKLGDLTSNFSAVYSDVKEKYLLNQENYFDLLVDKEALDESLQQHAEWYASNLIRYVQLSIRMKSLYHLEKWFTQDAKFMKCDGTSRFAMEMFDELLQTPIEELPTFESIEVKEVKMNETNLNFTTRIDGRDVFYIAIYHGLEGRWKIKQESCSGFFPALINQTELEMLIAVGIVKRFLEAAVMLSPKRMDEVAAERIVVARCEFDEGLSGLLRFYHYLYRMHFYNLDEDFNVSDVVFNETSGSIKFVTRMNKFSTNEIHVERKNRKYRLVKIKNLKCLDYSQPDMRSHKVHKYLHAMADAEKLMARYVYFMRTGDVEECSSLFTDPYKTPTGEMTEEYCQFGRGDTKYPDIYVMDIKYDKWGLKRFHAQSPSWTKGFNFTVFKQFARQKLQSESYYDKSTFVLKTAFC